MKSTNKILITTKKWHNHFSVLILNLTKNAPTKVISLVFIQADDTSNVAQLKDPCSSFFLIFLFATRTGSGKYFTTLRTGIKF